VGQKGIKSPEVLHYKYISERVDPTIDNGTPIVHVDSRDMLLPTKTKLPPAYTPTAKRV
jgi:hypothetical protein